jgi:hypothetical protein
MKLTKKRLQTALLSVAKTNKTNDEAGALTLHQSRSLPSAS